MSKDSNSRNNATALLEQEELVQAIGENSVCVTITTGSALGASLLAFNMVARSFGKEEHSPQEWVELLFANTLNAQKSVWMYSVKTRNNKKLHEELKVINRLFTVPSPEHPAYAERRMAKMDAIDACEAKYGVQ